MRRLVFMTQRLDPADPVLGATAAKVRALADRVDELVVLCDSADPSFRLRNLRVHEFRARTQAGRGARFLRALSAELRPRPIGVVAHMIPLFAVLAAPLVRPRRIPLALWYVHWKSHAVLRAAVAVSTDVFSVSSASFPFPYPSLHEIGHGIDLSEFAPAPEPPAGGELRVLVLGRYAPVKGLETILRAASLADAHVEGHGPSSPDGAYLASLRAAFPDADLAGPVDRSSVPALFAGCHVLVNNTRAGADKVVYEAAAAGVPVLASSAVFADLLPDELRFAPDDAEGLAARMRGIDRRRRPELRARVEERHSVEHWADALLTTLAGT